MIVFSICSNAAWFGPTNGCETGAAASDASNRSTMWPGAAGKWLLRIIVGAILRMPSSSTASASLSTLCSHGESTVAQKTCPSRRSLPDQVGGVLRNRREERSKAVGTEERPRFVVVEARGGRVVEHWRSDRGQRAVAHRDRLAWVDEIDPVHRQRPEDAHSPCDVWTSSI